VSIITGEHSKMNQKDILSMIENKFSNVYVSADELPKPYVGSESIKAIMLGTDPGNYIKGETLFFDYVFALENSNSPYFREIQKNIDVLGKLSLENLYVQNLCKNYFNCDASNNNHWKEVAEIWLPHIISEFDQQLDKNVPILVSAEIILDVILKNPRTKKQAEDYYSDVIFIDKEENHFGRTLIPFFRHHKYNLSNWDKYREALDSYFSEL
jgi:hypothetical protein